MFYAYILYSKELNKFYTGQPEDLERRQEEHNRGKTSFIKKGMPWELVYQKRLKTKAETMRLEKSIKKRGAGRYLADQGIEIG